MTTWKRLTKVQATLSSPDIEANDVGFTGVTQDGEQVGFVLPCEEGLHLGEGLVRTANKVRQARQKAEAETIQRIAESR